MDILKEALIKDMDIKLSSKSNKDRFFKVSVNSKVVFKCEKLSSASQVFNRICEEEYKKWLL